MGNFLIFAGTSSIAQAIAKRLLAKQQRAIITGRDQAKTFAVAEELGVDYLITDMTDFNQVSQIFATCIERYETIDGVVNCAGSLLLKTAEAISEQEYADTIAANLTTAFTTVRAAGKYMAKTGGSVVLLSSAAALVGLANHEAIAAAKAGIIGLALSAAATYANKNLRFNVVAPGLVATHLTQPLLASAQGQAISAAMHPLGKIGRVDDIASAVCYFLDPENDWVTGQVLAVDGGLSRIKAKMKY